MKKLTYSLLLVLTSAFLFISCATAPSKVANEDLMGEFQNAPKWVLGSDSEGGMSAIGSTKIGMAGIGFARTEAMASGRDELARQMSLKVKNMVKSFTQQIGLGDEQAMDKVSSQVSKQVANQVLTGSKQKDLWISPSKDLYVLVVIDPNMIKDSIKNAVKTSYKNEESLWQQFQAKNGHEALDKEIDKEFGKGK